MKTIGLPELAQVLKAAVGPQDHWWRETTPSAVIIQSILIQNATSIKVEEVSRIIENTIGFDLAGWQNLSLSEIETIIKPAGLYHSKAKYIQAAAKYFAEYHFDMTSFAELSTEELRKQLRALPGIGNETADVWLVFVFDRSKFIADSYARRLFVKLGAESSLTYEQLQRGFEAAFPLDNLTARRWHASIDEFGKRYFRRKPVIADSLTDLTLAPAILNQFQ